MLSLNVEETRLKFPERFSEIKKIAQLFQGGSYMVKTKHTSKSIPNQQSTFVPNDRPVFIYGPSQTGKSAVITSLFKNSIVNLKESVEFDPRVSKSITLYIPILFYIDDIRGFFKVLHSTLKHFYFPEEKSISYTSIPKISALLRNISSEYPLQQIFLIIDDAHHLVKMNSNDLTSIMRFNDILQFQADDNPHNSNTNNFIHLCSIFISQHPFPYFIKRSKTNFPVPYSFRFCPYSQLSLESIVVRHFTKHNKLATNLLHDALVSLFRVFYSVMGPLSSDIKLYIVPLEKLFPLFCKPLEKDSSLTPNQLIQWISPLISRTVQSFYSSSLETFILTKSFVDRASDSTVDFIGRLDRKMRAALKIRILPILAQYLLVACFIASMNPVSTDDIILKTSSYQDSISNQSKNNTQGISKEKPRNKAHNSSSKSNNPPVHTNYKFNIKRALKILLSILPDDKMLNKHGIDGDSLHNLESFDSSHIPSTIPTLTSAFSLVQQLVTAEFLGRSNSNNKYGLTSSENSYTCLIDRTLAEILSHNIQVDLTLHIYSAFN